MPHHTAPSYVLRAERAIPELGVPAGAFLVVQPEAADRRLVVTWEPEDAAAALYAALAEPGAVSLVEVDGLASALGLASVADGSGSAMMHHGSDGPDAPETSPQLLDALLHVLRRQYGVRPAPPRGLSLVRTQAG